jgi:hypothetical protein
MPLLSTYHTVDREVVCRESLVYGHQGEAQREADAL